MDSIKLKDLLQKHVSGTISEPERLILWMELEKPENAVEIKAVLLELSLESREAGSYNPDEWEGMITSILNADKVYKIESPDPEAAPVYEIKPGRKQLTWAAAAAILILISAGSYFFISKMSEKEFASTNNPTTFSNIDITPASNKAVLILSTGKQIELDSAKNGQLAKFGNTTISKTDNGKLLYSSSGSKIDADETIFNTLTTPRGGIYELTLPDGTKAWLNADSRIDYPTRFTGKKREVFINGEVYFEVAKDATHPFLVSLAAKTHEQGENGHWMQIEVLGTHFNINAYEDNKNEDPNKVPNLNPTRTTLLEGSIKITIGKESKLIKPGEQAIAGFGSKGIDIDQNVNIDKVMAWRNDKIAITDVSVKQLMTEISRWYDVDVEYAGTIPNKQFYGSIRRDVPLSTVLNALRAYGVETRMEGKKIIVE